MTRRVDFLIIGAGLAGSILAWRLKESGAEVLLVSDPEIPAASRAAAGLINPVTGQRLVLQENIEALLDAADRFYGDLEDRFDIELLHRCDMLRLFRSDRERDAWEKRRKDAFYAAYIEGSLSRQDGFVQHRTGWLDTNLLLDSLHGGLRRSGDMIDGRFEHGALDLSSGQPVWGDVAASMVIFCEGWRGMHNPWFNYLPFQPAKGEILTLNGDSPAQIINRGKWLLPIDGKRFKLGATYDWQQLNEESTGEAKRVLLEALPTLLADSTAAEVTEQVAGVRPGTLDKHPFMGTHPDYPSLAIFNGFGSKGSLLIPWYADRFTEHLTDDTPLPADADIARFHARNIAGR